MNFFTMALALGMNNELNDYEFNGNDKGLDSL
jgi:hypothetical protein